MADKAKISLVPIGREREAEHAQPDVRDRTRQVFNDEQLRQVIMHQESRKASEAASYREEAPKLASVQSAEPIKTAINPVPEKPKQTVSEIPTAERPADVPVSVETPTWPFPDVAETTLPEPVRAELAEEFEPLGQVHPISEALAADFFLQEGQPEPIEATDDEDGTGTDVLIVPQDELLDEIPGLALFYAETEDGEAAEQFDYPDGLPLETRLELSLFNEDSLTEEPEKTDEAPAVGHLFEIAAEQPDLTALLEPLEPERAEAVQPVMAVIAQLVMEINKLPDTEDEAAETERLVKEQALEEWCARLLDYLGMDTDEETVKHFISLMTKAETGQTEGEEYISEPAMIDKGTHEYKTAARLANFIRWISDIRQRLSQPLGRYTLRVAVPRLSPGLAFAPVSL